MLHFHDFGPGFVNNKTICALLSGRVMSVACLGEDLLDFVDQPLKNHTIKYMTETHLYQEKFVTFFFKIRVILQIDSMIFGRYAGLTLPQANHLISIKHCSNNISKSESQIN